MKSKLYLHHQWGQEKTDKYWKYWEEGSNTQLDDGEYIELFKESDCIIHDSGSFLVEYLFVKKPAMYLMTNKTKKNLNKFGLQALKSYELAFNEEQIKSFINDVVGKKVAIKYDCSLFLEQHIKDFFNGNLPSDKIISNIKNTIQGI